MKPICTALVAAAVALTLTAGASPAVLPKLTGTVGPGFTITLKRGTARVSVLKAGFYNLTVADKASIHDFHIEGPGLDKAVTTVGFTGTKTVRIHLRKGKYKYYCKPHESSMFGFFTVT
jgi:plastocyanin